MDHRNSNGSPAAEKVTPASESAARAIHDAMRLTDGFEIETAQRYADAAINALNVSDLREMNTRLHRRVVALVADLEECLAYFKDRYDVVDGDYGCSAPNQEMQLGTMIEETLHGIQF